MPVFDPTTQDATLRISPSGPPLHIPLPLIDSFNDETVSIVLNYGTQLGAAITMLLVVLFTTPPSKFLRTAHLLHLLGLLVCIVRTVLLALYFESPFAHFYAVWSNDYSGVPAWTYRESVAGTVFSMLLVAVNDVALMNQAWTMVSLWPTGTKYVLCAVSLLVSLLSVAARTAFTVIQCKAIYDLTPAIQFTWLVHAMVILNICTTVWFCALFNSKIIIHLITNRGVLPSRRAMSPMEVLVVTNGVLMIIPGNTTSRSSHPVSPITNNLFLHSHLRLHRVPPHLKLRVQLSHTSLHHPHPAARLSRRPAPGPNKPKRRSQYLRLSLFYRRRGLQEQPRLWLPHASESRLAVCNFDQQQYFCGSVSLQFTKHRHSLC